MHLILLYPLTQKKSSQQKRGFTQFLQRYSDLSDLFYLKFTHASIFLQWYSFAERTANISENMVLLAKKLIYPKLSNYTDLYKMKFLRLSVFLVPKLLNRLGNLSTTNIGVQKNHQISTLHYILAAPLAE